MASNGSIREYGGNIAIVLFLADELQPNKAAKWQGKMEHG